MDGWMQTIQKSTVAIIGCDSYEPRKVYEAMLRGFTLLGGAGRFFKPAEKIVCKLNIISGNHPDMHVTTHPAIFEAVINCVQPLGVTLTYGDSPALESPAHGAKKSLFTDVAGRYEVHLGDFEHSRTVTYTQALIRGSFPVVNAILDADGVINLSKLKTHGLTRMTGAVKNMFGVLPGLSKAKCHAMMPMVQDFCSFLVDICMFVKPRLHIMDAIIAMEGNGPQSGTPKKIGCILLSTDPVALDAVACRIIALNPEIIPTNKIGARAGLGVLDEKNIEIIGDPLQRFIDPSFNVVRKPPLLGQRQGVFRMINNSLLPKPVINASLCVKCGRCVTICPVEPKVVHWNDDDNRTAPPVYEYLRCIRCFCCQETCPQKAITIKSHVLQFVLPGIVLLLMGSQFITNVVRKRQLKMKRKK